eukprot:TRINITY_DN28960_c0_g1_i1.p1 TRINITY_DN28960_c0_g1~~TRINITY_DN28960_c0_g1_i1.p1  ORF type:complete len:493 (+),score=89.47 TRINITY_DN28960_c0_g1_i1:87-1481(+)
MPLAALLAASAAQAAAAGVLAERLAACGEAGGGPAAFADALECDWAAVRETLAAARKVPLQEGGTVGPADHSGFLAVGCQRPVAPECSHLFNSALLAEPLQSGRRCRGHRAPAEGGWPAGAPRLGRGGAPSGHCPPGGPCGVLVLDGVVTPAEAADLREHYARLHGAANPGEGPFRAWSVFPRQSARSPSRRRGHLLLLRVMERLRRATAGSFALRLPQLTFAEAFLTSHNASKRGHGDGTVLHCDESSYPQYHYSGVLYLDDHGADFSGGELSLFAPGGAAAAAAHNASVEVESLGLRLSGRRIAHVDPEGPAHRAGLRAGLRIARIAGELASDETAAAALRRHAEESDALQLAFEQPSNDPDGTDAAAAAADGARTRLVVLPRVGRLVAFSSGWENPHRVSPVLSGRRHSLAFFMSTGPPQPQRGVLRTALERFTALCAAPRSDAAWRRCERHWARIFTPKP